MELTVNEIYESIQGESTWAGRRCVFIRLTFCNLRCTYCDTAYAFYEGEKMSLEEIEAKVKAFVDEHRLRRWVFHRNISKGLGPYNREHEHEPVDT